MRLVDQLPRDSRYVSAMHDDPEAALELAQREEAGATEGDMPLRGWTHERELLTLAVEGIRHLQSTLIGVNSKDGKSPRVPPLPRPRTAVDRARTALDMQYSRNIVDLFLPPGRKG